MQNYRHVMLKNKVFLLIKTNLINRNIIISNILAFIREYIENKL